MRPIPRTGSQSSRRTWRRGREFAAPESHEPLAPGRPGSMTLERAGSPHIPHGPGTAQVLYLSV